MYFSTECLSKEQDEETLTPIDLTSPSASKRRKMDSPIEISSSSTIEVKRQRNTQKSTAQTQLEVRPRLQLESRSQPVRRTRKEVDKQQTQQSQCNRNNLQAMIRLIKENKKHLTEAHKVALKKTPFWLLIDAILEKKLVSTQCRKCDKVVAQIIESYDSESRSFCFGGKKLEMTRDDVKLILGITCGDREIPEIAWKKGDVELSRKWKVEDNRLSITIMKKNS